MNNKAMTPTGKCACKTCQGKKTVPVTVKGAKADKPCPSCKGSGNGSYCTK